MLTLRSGLLIHCIAFLFLGTGKAQISFADSSANLANQLVTSGVAIGVADMNNDGLDDIVRLDNASDLVIDHQQPNGSFTSYTYGSVGSGSEWSLCIADFDHNGYNDVMAGGFYNDLKILQADSAGFGYTSFDLPGPTIFLQGSNFADIDNDGFADIFACHDHGLSKPYRNQGDGSFTLDTFLIPTFSTVPSDNSGNYGSVWTDYDSDGDLDMYLSKCRGGVGNPMDGRRLNMLFENDGNNNYTDVAEAVGLRPLAQSWATAFADFDNDGHLDCFIVNHDSISQIYHNDGTNNFINVTATSGIVSEIQGVGIGIQVILQDFDNDALIDILLTGRSNAHALFKNDGDLTFTPITNPFPSGSAGGMQSAATGDLNHDGFVDVLAGFANGYNGPSQDEDMLFINTTANGNHFLVVGLIGEACNINGIGSRIEIYTDTIKQIREVNAGESYGIMNSMYKHFGLAGHGVVDSLIVRWTNGTVDVMRDFAADQFLTIREGYGQCNISVAQNRTVTSTASDGAGSLRAQIEDACNGDSVTIDPSLAGATFIPGGEIAIHRSISLFGLGVHQSFLDGGNTSRIFHIQSGAEVRIRDLTMQNASEPTDGGAILNEGTLFLEDVRFEKNLQSGMTKAFTNLNVVNVHGGVVHVKQ